MMHREMPKLYSDDWVGDTDCNQEILNDTKRNKVIVYRPFDTLFASFVVKKTHQLTCGLQHLQIRSNNHGQL